MVRWLSSAALVVAVSFLLVGCDAGTSDPTEPRLTTDGSLTYDSRGDYAGVFGVVRTGVNRGAFCAFIDGATGIGRGRVNLIFPGGYTATRDGGVRDSEGATAVTRGRKVAVSVMPELTDQLPEGCSTAGTGTARALHVEPYE